MAFKSSSRFSLTVQNAKENSNNSTKQECPCTTTPTDVKKREPKMEISIELGNKHGIRMARWDLWRQNLRPFVFAFASLKRGDVWSQDQLTHFSRQDICQNYFPRKKLDILVDALPGIDRHTQAWRKMALHSNQILHRFRCWLNNRWTLNTGKAYRTTCFLKLKSGTLESVPIPVWRAPDIWEHKSIGQKASVWNTNTIPCPGQKNFAGNLRMFTLVPKSDGVNKASMAMGERAFQKASLKAFPALHIQTYGSRLIRTNKTKKKFFRIGEFQIKCAE